MILLGISYDCNTICLRCYYAVTMILKRFAIRLSYDVAMWLLIFYYDFIMIVVWLSYDVINIWILFYYDFIMILVSCYFYFTKMFLRLSFDFRKMLLILWYDFIKTFLRYYYVFIMCISCFVHLTSSFLRAAGREGKLLSAADVIEIYRSLDLQLCLKCVSVLLLYRPYNQKVECA
jgi:hypothetical protein